MRCHLEDRARLQQRQPGTAMLPQHFDLFQARCLLKQQDRAGIKPFEIAGIKDDPGRVAVTPLHADGPNVAKHQMSFGRWAGPLPRSAPKGCSQGAAAPASGAGR